MRERSVRQKNVQKSVNNGVKERFSGRGSAAARCLRCFKKSVTALLSLVVCLSAGCAYFLPDDADHRRLGTESDRNVDWYSSSEVHQDLLSLPSPKGRMTVSVYNFRDQTGQYLPQPANAFSTAVPQGTLPMLVSTLRQSGWFELVEREGLQNLLTERKILRARKDEKGDKKPIKALSAANVIVEGGILAYDTNIRTGGGGAKYVGIGSGGQYREDQVTIGLRVVDVNSGRIFNSVSVTKKLLSTQISANVFRYIRFKKLLEVEGGYTETDPAQVVVMDAIEAAVIKLIVSGVLQSHWALKYDADENHPLMEKYADSVAYATWKQKRHERRELARQKKRDQEQRNGQLAQQGQRAALGNQPSRVLPGGKRPVMQKPPQGQQGQPRPQNGRAVAGKPMGGVPAQHQQNRQMQNRAAAAQGGRKPLRKGSPPQQQMTKQMGSGPMGSKQMASKGAAKQAKRPRPSASAGAPIALESISVLQSAALNAKMAQQQKAELAKEMTQSITKNRAREQTLRPQKTMGDFYAIQLYAGRTDRALLSFLEEYPSLSGDVRQVREKYNGADWFAVVYGKYKSKARAQRALEELPLHIKDLSPWVRMLTQR